MKIKVKEGHAGVMTLNDGTQMNYGVIRVTQNLNKIIFFENILPVLNHNSFITTSPQS